MHSSAHRWQRPPRRQAVSREIPPPPTPCPAAPRLRGATLRRPRTPRQQMRGDRRRRARAPRDTPLQRAASGQRSCSLLIVEAGAMILLPKRREVALSCADAQLLRILAHDLHLDLPPRAVGPFVGGQVADGALGAD